MEKQRRTSWVLWIPNETRGINIHKNPADLADFEISLIFLFFKQM